MQTIKGRLLFAFFIVIALFVVATAIFFFLNLRVISQYREITDTMTAEYQLVETTSQLIAEFNLRMQSAGTDSTASQAAINSSKQKIDDLTRFLDSSIQDTGSLSSYLGFKASIDQLTQQIDNSLRRLEEGSIKDYFDDFNEANKLYGFVRDNGTTLLFSELQYSASVRDSINRTYFVTILFSLLSLVALILLSIIFVLRFAGKFTAPLRGLAVVAEKIAADDMTATIDQDLLAQTDETGSLARSFNTMLQKLFENIKKLDTTNKHLVDVTNDVSTQYTKLERMNKFMVNREMKMMELKKENAMFRDELKKAHVEVEENKD